MDQPDDANASNVEQNHGSRIDGHIHDVSGRRKNGGDHKKDQDRAADMLEEELGVDDAHQPGEAEHDRQLKDESETQNNCEKDLAVFGDGDSGLESRAVMADQEIHGHRKNDLVSKITAGQEESHGENKERKNEALFMPVKSGRDEAPDLVQDHRRGHKNPGHQSYLHVQVKGIGRIEVGQLRIKLVFIEYLDDRLLNPGEDVIRGKIPARQKTYSHGSNGIDDAFAQLV